MAAAASIASTVSARRWRDRRIVQRARQSGDAEHVHLIGRIAQRAVSRAVVAHRRDEQNAARGDLPHLNTGN
jgi:hypothetical protein